MYLLWLFENNRMNFQNCPQILFQFPSIFGLGKRGLDLKQALCFIL